MIIRGQLSLHDHQRAIDLQRVIVARKATVR